MLVIYDETSTTPLIFPCFVLVMEVKCIHLDYKNIKTILWLESFNVFPVLLFTQMFGMFSWNESL